MKHLLPTELVNKVLAYLASKAYSEVSALIAEIQSKAEAYEESVQKSLQSSDSEAK